MSSLHTLAASILLQGFIAKNLGEEPLVLPKQTDESKQLHLTRAEAKRQRRAQRNLRAQS